MLQVITRFHNLRRIDMMGCFNVTAPVVEKFCAAKVVFKRMESINVAWRRLLLFNPLIKYHM